MARNERKSVSPAQSLGYKSGPMSYTSIPPFPISFFMLRVHLNTSFTTDDRILHIGLCMPRICTDNDVKNIVESTSKSSTSVRVNVEAVRSHHNYFFIWYDRTFLILW